MYVVSCLSYFRTGTVYVSDASEEGKLTQNFYLKDQRNNFCHGFLHHFSHQECRPLRAKQDGRDCPQWFKTQRLQSSAFFAVESDRTECARLFVESQISLLSYKTRSIALSPVLLCQMQVCFVARLSQRECVGNVVKCA